MSEAIHELSNLISGVATELGFLRIVPLPSFEFAPSIASLGYPDDRSASMMKILNSLNEFIVKHSPSSTKDLRLFVARYLPQFLLGYQSLRFPHIADSGSTTMPTKEDLSMFPEIINDTGLFVPVSTCLRLIAVSLLDAESKAELIDAGNVKAIVSHMVDDPLNPFQRESAIFVVKVLTTDFERGKRAISDFIAAGYRP
jgi:hypothetical protein